MAVDNDFLSGDAPAEQAPPVRMCFERLLPADLREKAAELAVRENPDNRPHVGAADPAHAALITGNKWAQNRVLRVKFLNGDPVVQNRIRKWASVWLNYVNLKFEWVGPGDPAEIRIAAAYKPEDGSWSYIGTDCLTIPANQETMRLSWLRPDDAEEDYSSVVLHEFGHALGLIHEHQSPAANIPWNRPKVYQVLGGPPNNWDKQTIDENMFDKLSADQTQYTQMDPRSIMMYPIDAALTTNGFSVGWNTTLSAMDVQFMSGVYPKSVAPPTPPPTPGPTPTPTPTPTPPPPGPVNPSPDATLLSVGARPLLRQLSASGGRDVFKFQVPRPGPYLISAVKVTGQSPYVVELHGHAFPNPNHIDRAGSINFRFDGGTHYFAVRAFDGRSTGQYAVSIRYMGR